MSKKKLPDLRVSISGVRGIVGRSFTDALVGDFARSFSVLVKRGKIVVAQDTRPTGERFRKVVIQKLRESGCAVVDIGISPTPTVLWMVRALKARGGIIVTASHNPALWNGLKFVGSDGQFLDERRIDRLARVRSQHFFSSTSHRQGPLYRNRSAVQQHLLQILRHLDVRSIRSRRFRVAIDPCNGTGAVATHHLLKKLGCRIFTINGKPDGRFAHPPEPTPEHLRQLSRFVREKCAEIGFAQDPDADRLTIVTEKGEPLSGEYTLALAIQWILSRKKGAVVINLSTSRMAEEVARRNGARVYYSKIGERHVVEKMRAVKAVIGGEGNGGVIYPTINPARDSFVGIGLILELLSYSEKPLSQWIGELPHYVMVQKKLTLSEERSRRLLETLPRRFPGGKVNPLDGIRIDLRDGWIHARLSNTEPVLRLISEASSKKKAEELIRRAL